MGKNKLTRLLALCLALVCLVGTVAALTYDLNGDGKTNVWDLQTAVNSSKSDAEKSAVLAEVLGGGDELHPNANGEYEIYTQLGLFKMAQMIDAGKDAEVTFKLMNDIDLQGLAWKSTETFDGTFEGNGHVISNVNVCGEIVLSSKSNDYGAGFFGKIGRTGLVSDLKLENVNVILTEESKADFVGLLTGSLTGEIHNCTTVGTVIDPRTTLPKTTYIGTLTGRVENVPSDPVVGITVDDQSILMTAETEEITAISSKSQKVLCKMGMDFGILSYPEDATSKPARKLGIAGWAPDYTNFKAYNWQDISGACTTVGGTGKTYNLEDPILTARRQAVVDKMYEICTVEWTPSQDMTIYYYKTGTGDSAGKLAYSTKTWKAGQTYRGMPYNHGSGSLERFEAWMQESTDSSGRLVTKTSLPTEAYYYGNSAVVATLGNYTDTTLQTPLTYTDPDTGKTYDLLPGFKVADQPMQVGETVKSADHAGFCRYVGNDCSQAIQWAWREVVSSDVKNGGTVISGVTQMAPTTTYQARYGVLPVGGLVPNTYSVAGWCEVLDTYGKTTVLDAYAQASKGDALIVDQVAGGHSRMIAYDPICIRNYAGVVQENVSYIITYEQGHGSSGTDNGVAWSSTCHVDRVLSFETLLDEADHKATPGGTACQHYYPMTLPAFHDVDNKAVTSNVTYAKGVVKSNFYIISTTVDGVERFTSVGQHQTANSTTRVGAGYRDAHVQEDLTAIYGDLTGKTVTVLLSNGDIYTVNADTGAVTKTN